MSPQNRKMKKPNNTTKIPVQKEYPFARGFFCQDMTAVRRFCGFAVFGVLSLLIFP